MFVNPSINISIGNHGEKFLTSFRDYFIETELELLNFSSFYKFTLSDTILNYTELYNDENRQVIVDSIAIPKFNGREDLFTNISKENIGYFFRSSINESYNRLVNLVNQLETNINFNIININVIVSNLEEYNTIIINKLIESINTLSKSGDVKNISVKVFVVLSNDGGLLKKEEEILSYISIEELKAIQKKYENICHNVIFIDDKNTKAIFLNINEKSIGFVLNEFITYLMTNHYKMIGNLMNSEYISLGLGMLYFDEKYFKKYFHQNIINQKLRDELIIGNFGLNEPLIFKEATKILKHYLISSDEILNCSKVIKEKLKEIKKEDSALLKYKIFVATLLGKYDDIKDIDDLKEVEKISLHDVLFKTINKISYYIHEIPTINILAHKNLLDEISEIENELKEIQKEEVDEFRDGKIVKIKNELEKKQHIVDEEKKLIKKIFMDFENGEIEVIINSKMLVEFDKEIEMLSKKETILVKKRSSFIKRLFNPGLKEEAVKLASNIELLKGKKEKVSELYNSIKRQASQVSDLIEELEVPYIVINKSIDRLLRIKSNYDEKYRSSKLIDYLFVKNVIENKILNSYFKRNKNQLLANLHTITKKIFTLKNEYNDLDDFQYLIESKIEETVEDIIDFNIVNHLNKDYADLKLFSSEELDDIISDLLNISKPFFNSTNVYDASNFHKMMLHNKTNQHCIDTLHKNLNNEFTTAIPQQINTMNNHKFTLLKVAIINDFNDIVKYNICKKTYESEGIDRIIIT